MNASTALLYAFTAVVGFALGYCALGPLVWAIFG